MSWLLCLGLQPARSLCDPHLRFLTEVCELLGVSRTNFPDTDCSYVFVLYTVVALLSSKPEPL